jgi:cytochrome c biogenesis protein CcmG/thiol:disulfide interchange protein DsbE
MKNRWLLVAVGGVLLLTAFTPLPERMAGWLSGQRVEAQACSPDAPAANLDFTLKDMNGVEVKLADLKGKVVLLNFWATWCGPCRLEIPWFVELQEKYADQGFRVVGISVDDPPEALPPFAKRFNINYPLVVGVDREDVQKAYGPIFGVPMTFIIGRNGRICMKHVGPASKEQFESEIKSLL